MKLPYPNGLEPLALALIFTPEPVTTIAGISLLGYAAHAKQQQKKSITGRLKSSFNDLFTYEIKMDNHSSITYYVYPTREGQLPLSWPEDVHRPYYRSTVNRSRKGK